MLAYKAVRTEPDAVLVGTYGFDGKPKSHRLTPHTPAPESWGDVDYWDALRLPEGWNGEKPLRPLMPDSFASVDEALDCFRETFRILRTQKWAGRSHQVRILAEFAEEFIPLAKPRIDFRGKLKARKALVGLIADEIANDPTGALGLIPPGEPDDKIRFHIRIDRWALPGTIHVTRYGSDGVRKSSRWYGANQGSCSRPYEWLSMEAAKALGEGFHEIEAPEPTPHLKPKFLTGIVSGAVLTPYVSDEPDEEVVAPAPEPAEAWVIPSARLTLLGGRLAASTLRVPRGPVEVGEGYSPSWGPVERGGPARRPEVEVGATALDGLGHLVRGPPALAVSREAL